MPKRGMGPIRRRQLIAAAIATISEHGFAGATVAGIARRAGLSAGIVHHYFADKDDLLFATMRAVLEDLRSDAVRRQREANTPYRRLVAVIEASFGDDQFQEGVFSVWLALYGAARQSVRLQRILKLYHRRLRGNLRHDLVKLVERQRAMRIAETLAAMIDGLWLHYALLGSPAGPAIPRRLTLEMLDAQLAQ